MQIRSILLIVLLVNSFYAIAQQSGSSDIPLPPPVQIGSVSLYEDIDPITDEDNSFIAINEVDKFRSNPSQAVLAYRCDKGEPKALIANLPYLSGESIASTQAIFRFDKQLPSEFYWTPSVTNDAAFVYSLGSFLRRWIRVSHKSKRVVLRFTTPDGREFTHVFDLNGINEALPRLSCMTSLLGY